MKFNLINRLLDKFQREITISGKNKLYEFFQGYPNINKKKSDSPEACQLIDKYNNRVRAYNELGETLAYLLWQKWDELQPGVQNDFLGVVDEWQRLRSINRSSTGYFRNINQKMHELENKIYKLENDNDGIINLKKKIDKLRKKKSALVKVRKYF